MRELRAYLRHFRGRESGVLASALLLSVAAALPGLTVLLLERTLDGVLVQGRHEWLGPLCLAFFAIAVVRAAVTVGRTRMTKRIAWEVTSDLRRQLHRRLLQVDARDGLGSRLAALTSEVDELQYGISALVTLVRNPLTAAGLGITALWMAPGLSGWALLLIPLVVLTARWSGRRVHRSARASRQRREALSALAADQLQLAEMIAHFDAVEAEALRFGAIEVADRDARIDLEVERVLPSAATQVAVAAAAAVLLWVGGRQVVAGALLPGELLAFAVALGLLHRPLSGLAEVWSLWQRSAAALERVQTLLDEQAPDEPTLPLDLPPGPLRLRASGLRFGWTERPVLDGVDLEIEAGEVVALVGPSGVGKSTLLDLLAGWVRPWQGEVRLGEVPLLALSRADRRVVARVPQEDQLLDRSVAENLRLGAPEATDAELLGVLERVGADFVGALPGGLEAPVGEGGRLLSGGERQRLCVARALLTGPRVLLLDEATNQVDRVTEAQLLAGLRSAASDCAILLVAHDPATVALADRVLVLADGRISEPAPGRVVA